MPSLQKGGGQPINQARPRTTLGTPPPAATGKTLGNANFGGNPFDRKRASAAGNPMGVAPARAVAPTEQPTAPPAAAPPPAAPAPAAPAPTMGPTSNPAAAPGPDQYHQVMTQQFGAGNPFADSPAGPDPVAAANAQAQAFLDRNLTGLRERFAGTGMASSSARSALEQGAGAGAAEAGLGTGLAQLGVQQRGQDLDRAMQGYLGSAGLNLQQQQLPLQYLQSLLGGGETLMGLETSEQQSPLLQALLPFLTNFGINQTSGFQNQKI